MIELVVVIMIAAIFIATAVTYKQRHADTDVPVEIEILKSSIRFAQTKALNDAVDNNTWGLNFTSGGTSYTYYRNGEVAYYYDKNGNKVIVNLPGEYGSSPTHNLPSGMTITGSSVSFNQWGSPADGSGNPLNSNIIITLTRSGKPVSSFTVTKNTGFILIQ